MKVEGEGEESLRHHLLRLRLSTSPSTTKRGGLLAAPFLSSLHRDSILSALYTFRVFSVFRGSYIPFSSSRILTAAFFIAGSAALRRWFA